MNKKGLFLPQIQEQEDIENEIYYNSNEKEMSSNDGQNFDQLSQCNQEKQSNQSLYYNNDHRINTFQSQGMLPHFTLNSHRNNDYSIHNNTPTSIQNITFQGPFINKPQKKAYGDMTDTQKEEDKKKKRAERKKDKIDKMTADEKKEYYQGQAEYRRIRLSKMTKDEKMKYCKRQEGYRKTPKVSIFESMTKAEKTKYIKKKNDKQKAKKQTLNNQILVDVLQNQNITQIPINNTSQNIEQQFKIPRPKSKAQQVNEQMVYKQNVYEAPLKAQSRRDRSAIKQRSDRSI